VTTGDAALLADISALIALPSISSFDPELDLSNRPVVDWLASRLEDRGFTVEIQEVPGAAGKFNLIATLGRGTGGLVLSGHTDTVPFDDGKWNSDPFAVSARDGRLHGLGTADMKSFFALVLAACEGLTAADLDRPLIVLATADEETSMSGAKALAARGGLHARHAIIGEPTDFRPVRLHKGILMERIRVDGRSGHSGDPGQGVSALEGMHHVIHDLLEWRSALQREQRNDAFPVPVTTLNLGRVAGGDSPNRICGACELDVDLRMLPGMTVSEMRTRMRRRVSGVLENSGLKGSFEILFDGIDPLDTKPDAALVRVAEDLTGSEASGVVYGTEGPFLSRLGMDVVILGPGSIDQAHQPDEFLETNNLRDGVAVLRNMIARLCIDA
jgi:acetylornithine deacetylase